MELLSAPPVSGEFEEHRFDVFGFCTFVKFNPVDDLSWIGVFGHGRAGGTAIASSNEYAFIISNGKAYYISLKTKSLIYSENEHYLVDVTATQYPEMFIANDCIAIHIYSRSGHLWNTPRISWDSFRNIMVNGNNVSGEAWSPIEKNGLPFQIDLVNKTVTGGSYNEQQFR